MKSILLSLFIIGLTSTVSATHYHVSTTVAPTEDSQAYFVEFKIEKVTDEGYQLVGKPQFFCGENAPAEMRSGMEDEESFMAIQAEVRKTAASNAVHTTILIKENHEIVLDVENTISL